MCSGSSPDENEPPLLPPADYSKDIKNTGQAVGFGVRRAHHTRSPEVPGDFFRIR